MAAPIHPIRAVFLDFDGTLVESEPLHYESWLAAVRPFGATIEWDEYKIRLSGRSDREAGILLLTSVGIEPSDDLVKQVCRDKTVTYKARFLEELRLEAGIRQWIINSPDDLQIAVVSSSGTHEVEPILIQEEVRASLSFLVCGEEVQRLKPDPEPYLLAFQRAQAAAAGNGYAALTSENCLVFEDSEAGLTAARAAGLRVIEVKSPGEVPELLRRERLL
ncbi:MAG TPA: HAD family phosphatase [Bryobacterales bacterium]|nr:HAD family phosphatase [Bryobacterales bacterium]